MPQPSVTCRFTRAGKAFVVPPTSLRCPLPQKIGDTNILLDEIEFTLEMIEAGENALYVCDDVFSPKVDLEWIVTSVFSAMCIAQGRRPRLIAGEHSPRAR